MAVSPNTIRGLSFFRDLPETVVEDVARVCVPRTVSAREIVYLRGGAEGRVFLVLSGGVELYHANPESRIAVAVFKEGDFFGDLAFANHPTPLANEEQAQAVFETELCVLTTKDVIHLLGRHAGFAMTLLVSLRERLHQAESKIKDLAISSASIRILNELTRYALRSGEERDGFFEIKERLTHQLLSEMSGLARETVTKTIGALVKHGFISYTPARNLRLNIKKIVDECAGCMQLASASDQNRPR
ncbi:Crp/Fnr family transcriptional regulator [Candidatus Kaiserbacteria bacterium]|nr:Crp/Fnr family transcriptional regulator [Candidatus Kaiserbacteria bacterium]